MKIWKYIFGLLVLSAAAVWMAVGSLPDDNLYIIACDVGQGDAILLKHKSTQVLVDGGPNDKVLDCLGKHMPFWDNNIEVVIISHPHDDHIGGLVTVAQKYDLENVLTSGMDSGSQAYQALKSLVGGGGSRVVFADSSTTTGIGLIHLDAVWPTQEYLAGVKNSDIDPTSAVLGAFTTGMDANDLSLVILASFGEFDILLTGDAGPDVMEAIKNNPKMREVEYLKIPHHGSKNGVTQSLLQAASPDIAVISVGKNSWGHPHQQVLDMLTELGIMIKRTDVDGEVVVVTDGKSWWVK